MREYLDHDYLDKLSPDEKQWLSNFNEEWLTANFNHKGDVLHTNKKHKKEIYNRNNARNRDLMSILKQRGHINNPVNLSKTIDDNHGVCEKNNQEESVVELIDQKKKRKLTF